jgi:hypothetical protein
MNDWMRSLATLAIAFTAVVAAILVLAEVVVTGSGSSGESPSATPVAGQLGPPTQIGGVLTVNGDVQGSFVLDRESIEDGYALVGDDGRIAIAAGSPPSVVRVSYDGWEFYLDPGECELTVGERQVATGVAALGVRCTNVKEIRDKGTVTMEGTLGVAANVLGLRGNLPGTGGRIRVGDELLTIPAATLYAGPARVVNGIPGRYAGELHDEGGIVSLSFEYDVVTDALGLTELRYREGTVSVLADTCSVVLRNIGRLSPHAEVAELTLDCATIEIPRVGPVQVAGTIVVDVLYPSD